MNDARALQAPWRWTVLLGLIALVLLPAPAAAGDDVPETVQAAYDAGVGLLAKGDRPSLEKALALLDTRKDEALDSIDYWTLYARVWKGLDKDEAGLWDGIVKERQAKAPKSVVFDLARARAAKKAKEKKRWIDAALRRDKKNISARTAKGLWLLAEGDEDEGAEILEEVLEDDAGNVAAATGLANLSLDEGFPGEALEILESALEETKDAGLYHMAALCYERAAKDKDRQKTMAKALDAAAQALGMNPCEAHIKTYDKLLKQTGDAATAAKALKEHYTKTRHPMLAALLAESAFEAGDYEGALLGLTAADQGDLSVVKGLAESHARLGNKAEALKTAAKLLDMDSNGRLFAARTALWLGDHEGALKFLGALSDDNAKLLRARAHAWAGQPEEVAKLGAKEIRKGSRSGDDYLTLWFQARLFERLGAEMGPAVRKKLLAARFAAGKKVIAQGGDYQADIGEASTSGWPKRAVTYFRSSCGSLFEVSGDYIGQSIDFPGEDKMMTVYQSISGTTKCGSDERGIQVRFNAKKRKTTSRNGWIEFLGESDMKKLVDFAPAEKAYAEACVAWIDGKHEAAEQAAGKALRTEPGFSRVKAYRSIARALSPGGEKRADAKDAAKHVALWRDDFELRRAAILLRAWAGAEGLAEEITALAEREAALNVRDIAGL